MAISLLPSLVHSTAVPVTDMHRSKFAKADIVLEPVRGGSSSPRRFGEHSQMPSLFPDEDEDFDMYAACLAATEGLRRIRDTEMAAALEAIKQGDDRPLDEAKQEINMKYARGSARVLRSMGMPVKKFNDLGRAIAKDPELKKKVRVRTIEVFVAAS